MEFSLQMWHSTAVLIGPDAFTPFSGGGMSASTEAGGHHLQHRWATSHSNSLARIDGDSPSLFCLILPPLIGGLRDKTVFSGWGPRAQNAQGQSLIRLPRNLLRDDLSG